MRAYVRLPLSVSLFFLTFPTDGVSAQVVPDESVPTRVENTDTRTEVTGGSLVGNNLFHSFQEFSIPTGRSVRFDNPVTVTNIINRVTGTSVSNIDGTLGANGSANVFLLNPNGIIFGPDARLNIGGSFLATTASSIRFADGSEFSAVDTNPPVLTVSVPVGLQFGVAPRDIVNRANDQQQNIGLNNLPSGLQVPFGRTIALVGGDVRLENGNLTAYGGRIEIGGVGDGSFVSLNPDERGWRLGYEGVSRFRDITFSSRANIDASGPAGTIDLQGQRVKLEGDSIIVVTPIGLDDEGTRIGGASGNITVNAYESISLTSTSTDSFSAIIAQTESDDNSGSIYLNTSRLSILGGSAIFTGTIGLGNAGRIVIQASESIEIVGTGRTGSSFIDSSTIPNPGDPSVSRSGNAGDISIDTSRLTVRDGGRIESRSADAPIDKGIEPRGYRLPTKQSGGLGGTIEVNATSSIEVFGTGRIFVTDLSDGTEREVEVSSSISTSTGSEILGAGGSSDAGNIRFNTSLLRVAGGGTISVNSFDSSGAAGNLEITAGSVVVDNARLLVDSELSSGAAGDLQIRARTITLDNNAQFLADSSSGSGGNIALNAGEFLSLRRESEITANAGNNGNGGNIIINTPFIFASENSDITANAEGGTGGNITITAAGIFGIAFRPEPTFLSDITVSSRFARSGTFTLNRLDVDPRSELVNVPTEVIDTGDLIVRTCGAGGRLTGGEFTITGRGGLPIDPDRTLEMREGLVDFGDRPGGTSPTTLSPIDGRSPVPTEAIIEARGWIVSDGKIVLTDRPSVPATDRSPLSPPDCHFGSNRS
jgi:filamentous hemagglutinin family protein